MARSNKHLNQAAAEHDNPRSVWRRRHARFDASLHVAYLTADNTPAVAFSENLSQGGMFLRSATGLEVGAEVDFIVTLDDGDMPMEVRGEVLASTGHGARICFQPDQAVTERLGRFVAAQIVPRLEEEVARALPELHAVVELANIYADQNQYAAAIGLMRRQLHKRPRQLAIYEHTARLVCTHIVMAGEGTDAELEELSMLIEKGHALGPSSVLDTAKRTFGRFHAERQEAPSVQAPSVQAPSVQAPKAQSTLAQEASEKRDVILTQRSTLLTQREADLTARHTQLKSWEATLDARGQALDARESTLQMRNIGLQTTAAELDSRNAALDTAHTAHAARQAAADAREKSLGHASDLLEQRQQNLIEQSGQVAERHALVEERERAIAKFNAQLQSRQENITAREQALEEATRILRREQEEQAARRDANSRAMEEMRVNYTHSMQDVLQRVRAFSAGLRVKMTARNQEMTGMRKQVAAVAVLVAQREQALAEQERQLKQERLALDEREADAARKPTQPETQERLAQMHQLLRQAENDIAQRDQALALMKQTLMDTRAQLEQRNKELGISAQERVVGRVESSAPKRTDEIRKTVRTAPVEYRSGEHEVITMEEMSKEETHVKSENPLAPAPRWRIR